MKLELTLSTLALVLGALAHLLALPALEVIALLTAAVALGMLVSRFLGPSGPPGGP